MINQYVTYQEFADAPTGLNLQNLIAQGTNGQEQAAVNKLLQRASSIVDRTCYQSLYVETRTDTFRLTPDMRGVLNIQTPKFPVQSVSSIQYAVRPQDGFTSINTNVVSIGAGQYPRMVYAYADLWYLRGCGPLIVQMQYIAGFVSTTLSANVLQGAQSVTVTDATGITAGQSIPLYDGVNSEYLSVSSVSGTTVNLSTPLQNAHNAGCGVSLVPEAVKQATIMIATFLLNERSEGSVDMGFGSTRAMSGKPKNVNEYAMSLDILQPFKRVV